MSHPLNSPAGVPAYMALRDRIRADIIAGHITAGRRLTVAELVNRYQVSQMPVREALHGLEGEGLITILPRKGARVLSVDARLVRNVYDIRGVVEGLLFRLSLPNLTNSATTRLGQLQEEFREAAERGDTNAVFALNQSFHLLIYQHADNPAALEIYDRYANLIGSLRRHYGYSAARLAGMVEEHDSMLAALRDQDIERLEKIARVHCEGTKQEILSHLGEK